MLTKVRVQNFKAIADSGEIALDRLNAFIGRNGSGKSSIIEFLELLSNALEFDVRFASVPFRRGRDAIRGWRRESDTAVLSLTFDPGDVSAGDRVEYMLGLSAGEGGDSLEIASEALSVVFGDSTTEIIKTDDGVRAFRIPPTRQRGRVKGSRIRRPTAVGEREPGEWTRVDDRTTPALKFIDRSFSVGGHALRTWLEAATPLRLSPTAVAEFAPKRPTRGTRELDPLGLQTAELLSTLTKDELNSILEKLRFVSREFAQIESHKPSGPGDQRYFLLTERVRGRPIEIPAWVLSEGTRRLTALLAVLLRTRPAPLVMIEEVENGFDPWTLKFVVEELVAATERGTQVVVTSHSPFLMNLLPSEVFQFVSRTEDGARFSPIRDERGAARVLDAMGVGDAYAANLLGRKR